MAPPNPYYPERPGVSGDLVRESRMSEKLRLRMVRFAKKEGVKPAARAFGTTPKTVRQWVGRFDGTLKSLQELSRRPHRSPNKLSAEAEAEILAARKKAPCLGSRRLRAEFDLPYSEKAINRVLGEHGLLRPRRRRKHETKRLLREVKRKWRFLQQIDVDTKNLSDIPEYWALREELGLPKYQYTARDVTTGLCFVAFAHEISMLHSVIFAGAGTRTPGGVRLRPVEDDLAVGQRLRVRRQLAVVRPERVHPADRKRPGPEAQGDPAGGAPVPVGRGNVSQPRGDGVLRG